MIPSKFQPAYNPILFTINQEDDSTSYILNLLVGGITFPLRRDFINGTATFDVSPIVKNYFASKLADSINTVAADYFVEPKLYVNYSVGDTNYIALNAVAQLRESINYSSKLNKVLTTLSTIKVYDGFPMDVSILCGDNPIEVAAGTLFPNALNRLKVVNAGTITRVNYNLNTLGGEEILTLGGDNIVVGSTSLGVAVDECVPDNPYYVRWVHKDGGLDYWMFSYNQKRIVSLTENQTYKRYIQNQLLENGTDESYFKRAIKSVSVGAGMLNAIDYEALIGMALSPYIEVFDGGYWKRIIIESYSGESETKQTLNDFECTFLLPELNLQF